MGNISQRHQREQLSKGKYAAYNRSTHLYGVVRRTYASFVNRSTETLKFIWLDFDGNPQQYHAVRPGRKYHVYTFNTHQWVVEDLSGTVWASHVYGQSGVWTVRNRRESSVEHIVDLREGLRHPIWGKVFAHKFTNRNDRSTSKRVAPEASIKIKSYKPKTVDENDDSEDDERNSDLEAPLKSLAWYSPARLCS